MSSSAAVEQIAPLLADRLPPKMLTPWAELDGAWQAHLQTAFVDGSQPQFIIQPSNEAQLCAVITLAHEQEWPLLLCGRGSKIAWGNPMESSPLIVSTARMDRVIHHAVADLTVTCEAGITLSQLQLHLAKSNQFVPVEPCYSGKATIGGIIATADASSLRHRYGGLRDMLLGIQFVRADGQVAKAGGRVVKNVAGYDLMKLFTGAFGTLGVLSQVTLKTYPIPEDFKTVVLTGDLAQLTQAAEAIAPSTLNPVAFDWFSARLTRALNLGDTPAIALRFGNIAASTTEQSNEIRLLGQQLGLSVHILVNQPEQALWRELPIYLDRQHLRCKLGLLPAQLPGVMAHLTDASEDAFARFHYASGLGQLCDLPQTWDRSKLTKLREYCESHGGFLTLLEAPASLKRDFDVWGYGGNALGAMARLREQFDPSQILNPGRFLV